MSLPVVRRIHHRNAARVRVTYVVNVVVGAAFATVLHVTDSLPETTWPVKILLHGMMYPYPLFILLCFEHSMVRIGRSWVHGLVLTGTLYGSLVNPGSMIFWAIIGYVFSGLILGPAAAAVSRLFVKHVPDPNICIKCGYSLRGLPENRCPECGTEFDGSGVTDLDGEGPSATSASPS